MRSFMEFLKDCRRYDLTIVRWHGRIIADAEKTLGRRLTACEKEFITSRGGCIALEMIHDNVLAANRGQLERHLNSEADKDGREG